MLLDSRVGISQFRSHYKVQCGTLLYTPSINYWGQYPLSSFSTSLKRKGFGGTGLKKSLKNMHFTLAINATNALFANFLTEIENLADVLTEAFAAGMWYPPHPLYVHAWTPGKGKEMSNYL